MATLQECANSERFSDRLRSETDLLKKSLSLYEEGTAAYIQLEQQITDTSNRFNQYANGNLLCGISDGLPHLMGNASPTRIAEVAIPSVIFLYIAGCIGWAGRSYLLYTTTVDPKTETFGNEREVIINVPVAGKLMRDSLAWPLWAWGELVNGKLLRRSIKP